MQQHLNYKIDQGVTVIIPSESFPTLHHIMLNQSLIQSMLRERGALLFQDFNIDSPEKFKCLASAFTIELMHENGEHNPLAGIEKVYTPVDYSRQHKLLWHNENSFNKYWPMIIMFGCIKPADRGGETLLINSTDVLAALDPEVVKEFTEKGVMYIRNYEAGFGRSWQEIYCTQSKEEVEKKCIEQGISFKWENNKFSTSQIRPAIIKHPETGALSWFNQVQHWHPYCLQPEVRDYLKNMYSEEDLPRNCCLGDGTVISDDIIQHIMDTYDKFEISFPWKRGNVIVLDNILYAHARNPYSGNRTIVVTMGKPACFLDHVKPEVMSLGKTNVHLLEEKQYEQH